MTEMEWLKQESGLTDDELKAMETVAGAGKFKAMLVKVVAANEQAKSDVAKAESERLALEKRYNDEFIPEMRKVTQDSLRAQGEAARMKAELDAARQYGIVPEPAETPRAPGSPAPAAPTPSPDALTRADLDRLSAAQSRAIITLNDLNAEHYKLFKEPLPNSQALVDRVERERTLGHKDFTLQKAWEETHNVSAKRAEVAAAEQKKHDDEVAQRALKEYREKNGDNPHVRSGQPSRFSTYSPTDANSSKPWQKSPGLKRAGNKDWRETSVKKLSAA